MIIVGAKLHCWPSSAPDEDKIWKICLDLFSHFQDQIVLLIQDFLSLRRELRIGSWRVLLHFRRRGRLKQKLSQCNQQEKKSYADVNFFTRKEVLMKINSMTKTSLIRVMMHRQISPLPEPTSQRALSASALVRSEWTQEEEGLWAQRILEDRRSCADFVQYLTLIPLQ